MQAGRFRQDLYYRLNVIQIRVPPLRERLEDLRAISERVLERIARDAGVWPAPRLTRDALVHLSRYAVSRATCASSRTCCTAPWRCPAARRSTSYDLGLPERCSTDSAAQELDRLRAEAERRRGGAGARAAGRPAPLPSDLARYLDEVERDILVRALEHHRFNRTAAGASLGLSLRQMRYRMARLGVNVGGDLTGPSASERAECTLRARLARRLAAGGARASTSPNFGPRPDGTAVDAGRDPFDQPAARRVRRRRDRAPVHQPARLGRASVLRDDPRRCRCRRIS